MAQMARKGGSFSRISSSGVYVDGIDAITAKLNIYEKKLEDPQIGRDLVAKAFSVMEQQRFATGGSAPEFGIMSKWAPLAASTKANQLQRGASGDVLNQFGYLAEAAINPEYIPFGNKALQLLINPVNQGSKKMYPEKKWSSDLKSRSGNYGIYHQEGIGAKKREFVTITPAFRKLAAKIIAQWLVNQTEYQFKSNRSFESVHREMVSDLKKRRKKSTGAKRAEQKRMPIDQENHFDGVPRSNRSVAKKMSFGEYFQRHEMPKLRSNPAFTGKSLSAAGHQDELTFARTAVQDAKKAGVPPNSKYLIYLKAAERYKAADPAMLRE